MTRGGIVHAWGSDILQRRNFMDEPPTPPHRASEVTNTQRAHQGAPVPSVLLGQGSAQHAPGPSIHQDAPGQSSALSAPPLPLWVSQGAPQTTRPGYAPCGPRGFSHALEEGTRYRPTISTSGPGVGLPWGRSTRHTQPHLSST